MVAIKCSKCNKTWEEKSFITSNTYICPFCGADLDGSSFTREELNIRTALKEVIKNYDIEIIYDEKKVNAILMDYVPKLQKERKLIVSALKEGIAKELMKAKNLSPEEQKQSFTRCAKQLTSDLWLTEDASYYAVSSIAFAIGIDAEFEIERNSEPTKNINQNTSSQQFTENREVTKDLYDGIEDINKYLSNFETIGYKAFALNKKLNEVKIPKQIKIIRSKAFENCSNLLNIKISAGIEYIAEQVFNGCYKLENIIVDSNNKYCVTNNILIDKSERKALRAANKETLEISIPNGITTVCSRAFDRNLVGKISLPRTVNKISQKAFFECYKLKEFYVDRNNTAFCSLNGVLHSKDKSKLILYPIGKKSNSYFVEDYVTEICNKAFSKAIYLTSITFNTVIKCIGAGAFEYCQSIESIMLPYSVEKIGERAFQYCTKLKNVMLSKNINEIGDFAFCQCKNLESISIPVNVERIGNSAFSYCTKLKNVVIQENVKHIGESAFEGCLPSLHIAIKNNLYVENYCRSYNILFDVL